MVGEKTMRSLNFRHSDFDKIINGKKRNTIRGLYVPTFVEGDSVLFKEILKNKEVGRTLIARISYVRPIRVKDINDSIAIYEGFKNKEESISFLKGTYNLKSLKRWVFVIWWDKISELKRQTKLREFTNGQI